MRYLFVLIVALVMSCDDDTTPSVPADMTVHPHDCAGYVLCSCQDGTCLRISACGSVRCADACGSHGGAAGGVCAGDGGL